MFYEQSAAHIVPKQVHSFQTADILFKLIPYVKGTTIFPYFIQDDLNDLYFVTCATRGLNKLPFQEFTTSFDKWTWLLVAISIVAVLIPIKSLSEKEIKIQSHWMSPFKVMLEQGDPFMDK